MLIEKTRNWKRDITATGYIVNREKTKILLIFHKKLQKWLPPGGHVEEGELPHEAVLREVQEEVGISAQFDTDSLTPELGLQGEVDIQVPEPYALLYQIIPASSKEEAHIHFDFVYPLICTSEEVTLGDAGVVEIRWFYKDEVKDIDCFDAVRGFAEQYLK